MDDVPVAVGEVGATSLVFSVITRGEAVSVKSYKRHHNLHTSTNCIRFLQPQPLTDCLGILRYEYCLIFLLNTFDDIRLKI